MSWLVLACSPPEVAAPSATSGDSAATEVDRAATCTEGRLPDRLEDAVTYALTGSDALGDNDLGWKTAVGDIDGDGLDDIAVNGKSSPYVYLVRGKTLTAHPPGTYVLADIADYRFAINPDGDGYGGWDIAVLLEPGHLYVSAPIASGRAMAYRIDWDPLAGLAAGEYALPDVASVIFTGREPEGTWIASCDVNGDGARDLVLGSRYLVLGPIEPGHIDVDEQAVLIKNLEDGYFCGGRQSDWGLRQCGDFNGDGFDDMMYACTGLGIYYGSQSMGTTVVDLAYPDVEVDFPVPEGGVQWIAGTSESVADWDGDGNNDLFVSRMWGGPDPYEQGADALLFLGGEGFYARGTSLQREEAYLTVSEPNFLTFATSVSIAGDLNGDGFRDIVVGDPDPDLYAGGHLYIRYCGVDGDTALSSTNFADTTYDGAKHTFGADVGHSVQTRGDIDGNERADVVLAVPMPVSYGGIEVIIR